MHQNKQKCLNSTSQMKNKITSYLSKKITKTLNGHELKQACIQSISSLYFKQRANGIQKKINDHTLANSMTNIEVNKPLSNLQVSSCLSHSSSKMQKSDLYINKQIRKVSCGNPKLRNCSDSSLNVFVSNKKETKAKDKLVHGLRCNYNKNKMILKHILTTNLSRDYSTINESAETPSKKKGKLKFTQLNNQQMKFIAEGSNRQLKPKKLYIDTCKDSDYLLNSHVGDKDHIFQFYNHTDSNQLLHNSRVITDIQIKINNINKNKTNKSKSKKYNLIKSIFDELIIHYPVEQQPTLRQISTIYHEVALAFSKENKKLKESNEAYQQKIVNIEQSYQTAIKTIQKKEHEVECLKKKILEYEKSTSPISFSKRTESSPLGENTDQIETINVTKYLSGISQQNIEDLDSLYFFDKVPTGSNLISNKSIPMLNFAEGMFPLRIESKKNNNKVIRTNIVTKLLKKETTTAKLNRKNSKIK